MSLLVPNAPKRITRHRDELDDFLSSDLEASFASSMSLNSPPRTSSAAVSQHLPIHSPVPMDISPLPPVLSSRPRSRTFGTELANTLNHEVLIRNLHKPTSEKQLLKTPGAAGSNDTTSLNKSRQRSALPTLWMQQSSTPGGVVAMDVDSPCPAHPSVDISSRSDGSRKRRSTEPEPEVEPSPSSDLEPLSSPSNRKPRKFERFASSGVVFPLPTVNPAKRPRRPVLSEIISSTQENRPAQSAYPLLTQNPEEAKFVSAAPQPRRALSAVVSASLLPPIPGELSVSSSDESFVHSSPAAEYAKRSDQRVLRRRDGREEFRPKGGASALQVQMNPSPRDCMPPFGAEAYGKILPCTSVREDGLMRITSATLASLLRGTYDSEVSSYHIMDCRFDYEYAGGHIADAVNISTTTGIEDMLLRSKRVMPEPCSSGDGKKGKTVLIFHCEFSLHRAPTIAKHLRARDRAMNNHLYPKVHYPEVYILLGGYAQFFREYPQLCEPRAYIRMDDPSHSQRCDADLGNFRKGKWTRTRSYTYGDIGSSRIRPSSLITAASLSKQVQRNTAPSGGNGVGSLFAAANAARSRRAGALEHGADEEVALATLDEHDHDHEADTSGSCLEHGLGDSPCPPTGTNRFSSASMMRAATLRGL